MRQPTKEEFEKIKQLARTSQAMATKAQLAACLLEDALNDLRESCDAPGNGTISMANDGVARWTDREGKPFGQPMGKANGERHEVTKPREKRT